VQHDKRRRFCGVVERGAAVRLLHRWVGPGGQQHLDQLNVPWLGSHVQARFTVAVSALDVGAARQQELADLDPAVERREQQRGPPFAAVLEVDAGPESAQACSGVYPRSSALPAVALCESKSLQTSMWPWSAASISGARFHRASSVLTSCPLPSR
jgi:hypothetical protein